ncbi:MAG: serine hydrolase [bacterium]
MIHRLPTATGALLAAAALAALAALPACTFLNRGFTYARIDPILDVGWYAPSEFVVGNPGTPLPTDTDEDTTLPRQALLRVTDYARRMKSCALLVLHHGRIVLERYWCGRTRASRYQTQSLAKPVLALLTGLAIRDGRIPSVDTPVARYLPGWAGDARSAITIRHLLQMTSGLDLGPLVRIHIGTDVRGYTLGVPAEFPPGRRYRYNNMNAQILGLLLEQVFGERYSQLLSRLLWRPLGAQHASVWLDIPGGTAKTYCCLMATARDWARIGLLLQHRGRVGSRQVVPTRWIDAMLRPSARNPAFGYFAWLGNAHSPGRRHDWKKPFLAQDTVVLMGRREQRVFVIRSHGLVIVRIGREAGPRWEDTFLPNTLVRALLRQAPRMQPPRMQQPRMQQPRMQPPRKQPPRQRKP